jgi:hypothetical protein
MTAIVDTDERDALDWIESKEGLEAIAECNGSRAREIVAAFKAGMEKERGRQ